MTRQPTDMTYRHYFSLIKKTISLFFFLLIGVSISSAADISQGYAWLAAQQQTDGSIESDSSLAHPLQSTAEAILAFDADSNTQVLNRTQALVFISTNTEFSTEFLVRALQLDITVDGSREPLLNKLLSHQNINGGFGSFLGFESNVLDTALALSAISNVKAANQQTVGRAVQYLLDKQSPNGDFSLYLSETASLPLTAIVSIALQNYIFDYAATSQAISAANQYLLSNQPADSDEENWQSALSLLAVIPTVRDSARYASLVDGLRKAQLTNGSWADDDFTTALVIRALQLADNITFPEEPATGVFSGQVLDLDTGNPLANVSVTVTENTDLLTVTDELGRFSFDEVLPSSYTIVYQIAGYLGASQTAGVVVGQVTNLGEVRLQRLPNTGVVAGTVTDAITAQVLPSASLVFSSANNTVIAPFDASGNYSVALTPDTYNFVISAVGYQSLAGVASVAAGNNLVFSPALYPENETPVETVITLVGRVVDAATSAPIVNASVQIASVITTNTNSNGDFTLSDLAEGEATIVINADGYASRQLKFFAPAGSQGNTGNIALTPIEEPVSNSVFGTITNSETGEAILGATVLLEETGVAVTSSSTGGYVMSDIEPLSFTLFVSAPGYWSQRAGFSFDQIGSSRFDVVLSPSDLGGFAIEQLISDELAYPAYSPVSISANLVNPSDQAVSAQLYLEIFDIDNTLIAGLPIGDVVGGNTPGEAISVLPNESASITAQWYTGIVAPGNYALKLSAYDQFTSQLLSEQVSYFDILETANISTANLTVNSRFSKVGVEENLMLMLNTVNRSNVPVNFTIEYQWADPAVNVLRNGNATLSLSPAEASKAFLLDEYLYTFDLGGIYPFTGLIASDQLSATVQGASIQVAPSVRVEATQGISPNPIVPDGDKRITIDITVEGVEQ